MRRALMLTATAALIATAAVAQSTQVIVGTAEAESRGVACANAKTSGRQGAMLQAAADGGKARIVDVDTTCDCGQSYERSRDPALAYRQWTCTVNVRFQIIGKDD